MHPEAFGALQSRVRPCLPRSAALLLERRRGRVYDGGTFTHLSIARLHSRRRAEQAEGQLATHARVVAINLLSRVSRFGQTFPAVFHGCRGSQGAAIT